MVVLHPSTLTYVLPPPFLPSTTSRPNAKRAHKRSPVSLRQWHAQPYLSHQRRPLSATRSSYLACDSSTPTSSSSTSENGRAENDSDSEIKNSSATDEPTNSGIDKRQRSWGPFKSWFPPNQQISNASQQQQPNSESASSQHAEELSSSSSSSSDNPSEDSFRWPWQNENNSPSNDKLSAGENIPTNAELKASTADTQRQKRRVTHSDSKPGASFGLDNANLVESSPTNGKMQDRWKQLVNVIIPAKSNLNSSAARIESNKSDVTNNKSNDTDTSTPKNDEERRGGIFELYKPPIDTKERSQNVNKPWFTPPWDRESSSSGDNQNGKSTINKDLSAPSPVAEDLTENISGPSKSTSSSPSSENNQTSNGETTTQKDWFVPPWKRRKTDMQSNVTPSDLPSNGEEFKSSISDDTSSSSVPDSTDKTTQLNAEKKLKVTYPSKKSWFRWPGAKKDDESPENESSDEVLASDAVITTSSKPIKSEDDSMSESDGKPERPDRETADSDVERNGDKDANGAEQKRKTLVGASLRSSSGGHSHSVESYSIPQRDISKIRQIFGSETFFATDTIPAPGGLLFHGNLRGEPQEAIDKLEDRLASRFGDKYTLCLAEGEDQGPVVVVVPTSYHQLSVASRHRLLAFGLALMTISTCMSRGLVANVLRPRIIQGYGLPATSMFLTRFMFTPVGGSVTVATAIGLLVVLSQIVRRIVASRYRTKLAMPFMLPSYQLGSFGAVVYLVSPAPNRAALFDIAISSAIAMVVPAMICLIVGLRLSTSFASVFPVPMSMVSGSLIMGFLTKFIPDGQILVDYQRSLIGLHPLAIIGANCLTIAALNLLPIRQLDGSRIVAAIFGRRAALRAWRMAVLYLLFASSKSPYLIMFLLIVSFGPWQVDRPSRNELTEPDNVRTIVGYLFMLLMIGLLLPYPKSAFFGTL